MENSAWREALAQNLSRLRREKGLTQAELGEKLNYSDKSVSKWERGEGVPDLTVLMQLCSMYGVTLSDIVGQEKPPEQPTEQMPARNNLKERIVGHTSLVVMIESGIWLVALIVFFVLMLALPEEAECWLAFIFALPVSFLSLGVCLLCWKNWLTALFSLSAALWTICLSVNLTANSAYAGIIYAIGGFVQLTALIVLSAFVYHSRRKARRAENLSAGRAQ